jgi:hypothetical protein
MAIPFSAGAPACAVVFMRDGERTFAVEVNFDCAGADDLSQLDAEGMPRFNVHFRISAIIQPATGDPPLSMPIPLAPPPIVVVTGLDGAGYEITINAEVIAASVGSTIDVSSEMPIPTASFALRSTTTRRTEETPGGVFACVYCGHAHTRDSMTDEHVIPRALLNRNYVLRGACRRLNNYFSHAFEKRALQLPVVRELLLLFDPPRRPVFRGDVAAPDGRTFQRWVLPRGRMEIGELPTYTQTNKATVEIELPTGTRQPIEITLPFSMTASVTGLDRLLNDRARITERDRQRLHEYLVELAKNPQANEDLSRALAATGGRFPPPRAVEVRESRLASAPPVQPESLTQELAGDDELLTKLFFKIAWTHAAKQLGRPALANRTSQWILEYLTTGHVIDSRIVKLAPDLFTVPVEIDGRPYAFWKSDLRTSARAILAIEQRAERATLERLFDYRAKRFQFGQQFIRVEHIPSIDDEVRTQVAERRYHELELTTVEAGAGKATVCHVRLFGGSLKAMVQLSEEPVTERYPPVLRIDF